MPIAALPMSDFSSLKKVQSELSFLTLEIMNRKRKVTILPALTPSMWKDQTTRINYQLGIVSLEIRH